MSAKRREIQSAESHAEILRAAVETIATRGCAGATVGRIADTAGLSTAAIFWHFRDKSGLLQAVAQHIMESWVAQVKRTALGEATARARLERMLRNHLEWVASGNSHVRAFVILALEARGLDEPAAADFVVDLFRLWQDYLSQLIEAGQTDGSIPGAVAPPCAAAVLADALLGAVVRHGGAPHLRGPEPADWVQSLMNGVLSRRAAT